MALSLPTPTFRRLLALAVSLALLAGLIPGLPAARIGAVQAPGTTFISEFHYDNSGTDAGEFIEVTAPAGTDLTGWSIVLYNGNGGAAYDTDALVGAVPDQVAGYGTVVIDYPVNGIQNGGDDPDGIALIDSLGAVVEFLSYEGAFAGVGGPAGGVMSTDIGVSQTSITTVGSSIERIGIIPGSYSWVSNSTNSKGAPNPGSIIGGTEIPSDEPPPPPPSEPCDVADEGLTPINQIQGSGAATPISGQTVTTRGVVTADFTSGGATGIPANQGMRGFFMEATAAHRDADPSTSEGVFVFDGDAVFAGDIGDLVAVEGTAGEFGGVTQVTASEIEVCDDSGILLPAAPTLPLPTAPGDRTALFEPLESMRVTHPELTVIEFFQLERFGEIRLSADGVLQTPTNVELPGSAAMEALAAANAAVNIVLDDGRTGQNLNRLDSDDLLPYVHEGGTLRIGDQLLDETFVLHFGFGAWRLQPLDIDQLTDELEANRTRPRPEEPPDVGGNLRVASFNVLNYFDGDGQGGGFPTARGAITPSELERQTQKLVDAITRLDADIYGLIEIENDGGEFQATRTLVNALNTAAGDEVYRFVDTGVIGTDEIKQAFIYNRGTVRPVGEFAILDSTVDPRFDDDRSRPALAQTFLRLGTGERVTVVVNHFKSKGSSGLTDMSDPDFDQGDGQGFWNHTRTLSAEALADWLATNPTGVQSLGTLIIGDLNAYGREDPIRALEDAGYENQLVAFTAGIPYTFTFDGMQGTLDTALALEGLAARITGAAVWHINADEVPAIDYLEAGPTSLGRFRTAEIAAAYFDPTAFRSSDHDPVLIGLDLGRSQHPGRP
ncbi:MAG: ExeM/NucH family extracellular endonuclease [Candidatus Limnocylindria bacterium]